MKYFFVVILIFLLHKSGKAQVITTEITYTVNIANPDTLIIFYNPLQLLTINNFKGIASDNTDAVAITSSGFAFKASFRNAGGKATLMIAVYCSFDQQQSWMKALGKNDYILKHEQQHFDISYLGALQFMRRLNTAAFTIDNYNELLETIYNQSTKKMEQLQHQYDTETSNGRITSKQIEWNNKIQAMLKQAKTDQAF